MTPESVKAALVAAGFAGIELDGATIFARDGAEAPEFTVDDGAAGLRLAQRFAVRATDGERAEWMRNHPAGRLEIVSGETELSLTLPAGADLTAGLALWRSLSRAAAQSAVAWRRRQKPLYGM